MIMNFRSEDGVIMASEMLVSNHLITWCKNSEIHDFYSLPWKTQIMYQEPVWVVNNAVDSFPWSWTSTLKQHSLWNIGFLFFSVKTSNYATRYEINYVVLSILLLLPHLYKTVGKIVDLCM